MHIGFGDVHGKVCRVFNIVMAIAGQAHEISAAALAFHHVADGFFQQLRLGQHADHQGSVLNQRNGSMLQLAGGVSLGMDVADLLHLQAALQADGVIHTPADEEHILGIGEFGGKPLNSFLILQHPFNLLRQRLQLLQHIIQTLLRKDPPDEGQLHGKQIGGDQLGAVRLGGCHSNLRSRQSVEHMIRFPGNGAAHHIDHSQGSHPPLLCFPQGSQAVGGFAALADDHHQTLGIQDELAVAEF